MSEFIYDKTLLTSLAKRLEEGRKYLIKTHPFFGRLLVHLRFGFADCGTAYTDMESIVFDPAFLDRISDDEMHFVLLHEVMHCVLKHCVRGLSLQQFLYNIACDIVVNSFIMEALGVLSFSIDGCSLMHLAPNGTEGREHTAEEVYKMLLKLSPQELGDIIENGRADSHDPWTREDVDGLCDMWDKNIRGAVKYSSDQGSGIPDSVKRVVAEVEHKSKAHWRLLLHNFILHDRADYTFSPPDRRYLGEDIILPSFNYSASGTRVENIWFFVDTSGSVSDREVAIAFAEIKEASAQVDNMSGFVCFFDTRVSSPESFESTEELDKITPVGGGGTSFYAVFDYIRKIPEEEKPAVVAIITDGCGVFPQEDQVPSIPVIWLLTEKGQVPPFGEVVYLE